MTNLLQNLEIDEDYFLELLLSGDLYAFEEELYKFVMNNIYDMLAEAFIKDVISNRIFEAKMRALAAGSRMGKLQKRFVNLQLRSGTYLKLEAKYARVAPKKVVGSRYLCPALLGSYCPRQSGLLRTSEQVFSFVRFV